jgi:hypothetical protein
VRSRGSQGGHRARRSGWSSPERQHGLEAVEDTLSGGVHRWGGSSSGQWRWRHNTTVSVQKREGEAASNGDIGGGWKGLTVKWQRRWRRRGAQAWTRSEALASSPNWRARGESREGNGGGGGSVPRRGRRTGERGGPGRDTAVRTTGSGWLRVAQSEATARARVGGGLVNRGGRRGKGDMVWRG